MFDFSPFLPLPLIWGGLVALAVFIYVLLDGFDLGVGILFPFAPSEDARAKLIGSIAPFWDGNETWLVLGTGGLLIAFPPAYGIVLSALYLPATAMLFGLILRGVSFEFRFKAGKRSRWVWDYAFHFGSLAAAFCQGLMLGGFIQGFQVTGRAFSGGVFDFLTPFAIFCGLAVVMSYALLGATWAIMKTEGTTQKWARRSAIYVLTYAVACLTVVSLATPFLNAQLAGRWLSNATWLFPLPLATAVTVAFLARSILLESEYQPFFLTTLLFVFSYTGFAISLWPWVVPYQLTFAQAAANGPNLSLLLVGALLVLPVILAYTGYCYWVFRGKAHSVDY
ncbi:MAG: cytochrome d ubiquinol oxidase subunit II [Proteobacteria bacterium]|nr:cytochrome d ubiquinol oxidase subunit II [Pseudomonadota bacterium]